MGLETFLGMTLTSGCKRYKQINALSHFAWTSVQLVVSFR